MVTFFNLSVDVNGSNPFSSISGFTLVQRFDRHHVFELRVPLEAIEDQGAREPNKSKKLVGESIKFKISGEDTSGGPSQMLNEFNGVVTGISLVRYGGTSSDLLVKGFGPTIILDHGVHTKVFGQTSLSGLISSITAKYPFNGVSFKINPSPDPQMPFTHQHQESTFNFICRLANRYGQWFLFDGANCIFGKLPSNDTIQLKFGSDLTDFDLGVSMVPNKFKTIALDGNSQLLQAPSLPVEHLDQLGTFAFDQSNKYFFEEQLYNSDQSVTSASDVQDIARIRRAALAADLVRFQGSGINAKLKIGCNISPYAENTEKRTSTVYGIFTIIAIKHTMDGRGNYRNNFKAIPSALEVPPPMRIVENMSFSTDAV